MREDLLHQILKKLSRLETKMDKRFEEQETKIDERFSEMDKRFSETDKRFSGMETNMNDRFSEMDKKLDMVTEHVARNSEKLSVHSNQLATLTQDVNIIKTDVKRIDKIANDANARLKTIENKLESKDSDTVVLNNRLFKLESTVQKLMNQ